MLGNITTNWSSAQDRCTESDYRQLFSSSSAELYELCFILTADENLARESFAAALGRTVKEATGVFREWTWSWARRQIIKACIAALRAEIQSDARTIGSAQTTDPEFFASGQLHASRSFAAAKVQKALTKLDVLPRFVFVLRNLERYSPREIALLLDVDRMTLASAYKNASDVIDLEQLDSGGQSKLVMRRSGKPDDVSLLSKQLGFRVVDSRLSEDSSGRANDLSPVALDPPRHSQGTSLPLQS